MLLPDRPSSTLPSYEEDRTFVMQGLSENRYLLGALVTLLLLSNIPYGRYMLYPFELFSTWIHEMCHGLAALAVGGDFLQLHLYPDTSGRALSRGVGSTWAKAIVASAGYIGTSFLGALLLLLQRPTRFSRSLAGMTLFTLSILLFVQVRTWSGIILFLWLIVSLGLLAFATPTPDIGRFGLFALGCSMLLTLLFASTPFTIAILLAGGGFCLLLGIRGSNAMAHFFFSFLAATCGLNALTGIQVLFAPHLVVNGQVVSSSDAHAVASYLFGSHQLWAGFWLIISISLLGWALWRTITSPSLNLAHDPDVHSPTT